MNIHMDETDNQRFYIFLMTLCFIMAIVVTYGSFISIAKNSNSEENGYKYYTSIQIQNGDTLWELASDYMSTEYASTNDYIKEVMSLNSLESDKIHEGQYLTVPYYSNKILD